MILCYFFNIHPKSQSFVGVVKLQKIHVNTSNPYNIIIGSAILETSGDIVKKVTKASKIALVTDDIVDSLYSEKVVNSLKKSGFNVIKFVFPNGEASKCFKTLNNLYDFLANNEITRSDCLVALGGGVVGDLTGYASATFLRGIDFIQIPTTLLAQVDSSIGGKTAIDIPAGKNLVGAFKQPLAVICDISTLSTLKPETFSDGMGEVVKYAMIRSYELFEILYNEDVNDNLEDIICRCIDIKRQIVENDEFDKGERMLLNFGHTFGHAIEKIQNFTGLSHGSAVSVGMCIITELAIKQGLCNEDTYTSLKKCLAKYNLPISVDISYEDLVKHCINDKKREADNINLVISTEIGKSELRKVPINSLFD